ncbi:MAG: hormogonium polysaccharide secretion pseudopilin HpsC [Desertifilum sp.]|nr:hormogonium polysaccharide secretion pseudopilin HpsC [Desertifilum sp.]
MKSIIRFILNRPLKSCKKALGLNSGFTLLELLVALVIASIIVSSLLGFMVDILNNDRREQAKSTSEQEIQAALDYIARDLEQAVYIYDAQGLAAITGNYSTATCTNSPVTGATALPTNCSQLPASPDRVPVLVFWKRHFLPRDANITVGGTNTTVGCLMNIQPGLCNNQDYQLYSLVAYYLIRDPNPNDGQTWSPTTRIGRFEIRDGIRNASTNPSVQGRDGNRTEIDVVSGNNTQVRYDLLPSPGFMPFNLAVVGNSVREKLNRWQKHQEAFNLNTNPVSVLIDYVDQTPIDPANPSNSPPLAEDCRTSIRQVNTTSNPTAYVPQQVPTFNPERTRTPALNPAIQPIPLDFQTGSFYACVDSERTIAQVYIRGNSLARITNRGQVRNQARFNPNQVGYFPSNRIQVQGRGLVNIQR